MRQAIIAKTLGPTNHRGMRIKVSCSAKTVIYSWDYEKDPSENHINAIIRLAIELEWFPQKGTKLTFGQLPDGYIVGVFYEVKS